MIVLRKYKLERKLVENGYGSIFVDPFGQEFGFLLRSQPEPTISGNMCKV